MNGRKIINVGRPGLKQRFRTFLTIILFGLILVIMGSCGSPPSVRLVVEPDTTILKAGQKVKITALSEEGVQYEWQPVKEGVLVPEGRAAFYTAPLLGKRTSVKVVVLVIDGKRRWTKVSHTFNIVTEDAKPKNHFSTLEERLSRLNIVLTEQGEEKKAMLMKWLEYPSSIYSDLITSTLQMLENRQPVLQVVVPLDVLERKYRQVKGIKAYVPTCVPHDIMSLRAAYVSVCRERNPNISESHKLVFDTIAPRRD